MSCTISRILRHYHGFANTLNRSEEAIRRRNQRFLSRVLIGGYFSVNYIFLHRVQALVVWTKTMCQVDNFNLTELHHRPVLDVEM
ncbi:hypothetical protein BDW69DRAFT_158196 [Aspergillus filifer]